MVVQHNMTAANANRMLGNIVGNQAKSTERLSSGYRINRAGDDAAGLAISEKMRGQIRGLDQASTNAQDGITLIQTAEGALSESQSILQRMRELSVQAANGTETDDDRAEIQKEVNQLTSELNRIGNTTEFNTMSLLKGDTKTADSKVSDISVLKEAEVSSGSTGVASNVIINEKSVKAESCTATLVNKLSTTTAEATDITESTKAKVANKANCKVMGVTIQAAEGGTNLNGATVEIATKTTGTSSAEYDAANKKLKLSFNKDELSTVKNSGQLNTLMARMISEGTGTSGVVSTVIPEGEDSSNDISADIQNLIDGGNITSKTMTGGTNATAGQYKFKLSEAFSEKDDSITIGGYTFKATTGAASSAASAYASDVESHSDAVADMQTQKKAIKDTLTDYNNKITQINSDSTNSPAVTDTMKTDYSNAYNAVVDALDDDTTTGASLTALIGTLKTNSGTLVAVATNKYGLLDAGFSDTTTTSYAGTGTGTLDVYKAQETLRKAAETDSTFRLGTTATGATTDIALETQGKDIAALLQAKLRGESDTSLATVAYDANTKTFTIGEDVSQAGKLSDFASTVTVKGSGEDETLTITDESGQNLQIEIATTAGDLGAVYSSPTGKSSTGKLTITLDNDKINTADNILEAIKGSTNATDDVIDFSRFKVETSDAWEENVIKTTFTNTNKSTTMTGGTKAVTGEYAFNVSKEFSVGDSLNINGQTFTAVADDAEKVGNNEFKVGTNLDEQINNLVSAMQKNSEFENYDISSNVITISLKEKEATGTDLSKDISVDATGIRGEFKVSTPDVVEANGTITIDDVDIKVSNKDEHTGYDNGTAIKATDNVEEQTQKLVDAINKNEELSTKYSASIDKDGAIVLKQKIASEDAPKVSTMGSTKANFDVTFQVGANSGQSMTISIQDNRALALGVSGDGSTSTIKAENGEVASYTEVQGVNNGSDNENIEYALDVSSYDKATAAIGVIDDALSSISSQRASLGAYQNRLEHTISNLDNTSENLQTAESNIRDVDMASEMVTYSKNSILQQAAQSMLAQANQSNQGVLSLLQ